MTRYLYSELSNLLTAKSNCERSGNTEWLTKHTETLEALVQEFMPRGSGFDSGTKLDWSASHPEKLVFSTAFHHMDEHGYYDGWTEHTVTVTPSLSGTPRIRVSGRNRNEIKDVIYEEFETALNRNPEFFVWSRVYDIRIGRNPETYVWEGSAALIEGGAYLFSSASREAVESNLVQYARENSTRVRRIDQ